MSIIIIEGQKIEVKIGTTNINYYKELGYENIHLGDIIVVNPNELKRTSKAKIKVLCDKCGIICEPTFQSYLESLELHNNKYYCRSCAQKSIETREKIKNTHINKYGTDNIMKNESVLAKIRETNLVRYGVEYPSLSSAIKEKIKQAYIKNNTFCGFLNKELLKKAQETLANSGKVLTSSLQEKLFETLKITYSDIELNKPCSNLNLDIVIKIENVLIDIEVDGVYWHSDINKDRKRDEVVKNYGYKVLRIRFRRELPDIALIYEGINKLVNSTHTFLQITANDINKQ